MHALRQNERVQQLQLPRHPAIIALAAVCVSILLVVAWIRRDDKTQASEEKHTPTATVSSPAAPVVESPSPSPTLTEEQLSTALLVANDLPNGFAVVPASSSPARSVSPQTDNAGCTTLFHSIGTTNKPAVEVKRHFATTDMGPSLSQTVGSFLDAATASTATTSLQPLLDQCSTTWTETYADSAMTYTVAAFTLPAYGEKSVALRISIASEDFRFHTVMAAIQQDKNATLLAFSSPLELTPKEVSPVAAQAAQKLKSLPTL